ncbi:hypothetical protein [Paenirhodobacter populi]|uniref:DUF2141 domain-containing protein n=1 Tax=Paenirhodobacter populi TaxID=2306993 RepID=A0A443IKV2_9RHOB|nr:hypothetical protein [Sinirhodobacter populi]RWR05810.1 hypothetical protein D2T33_19325 [Sinirhodobacter populi]
MRNLLPVPLVCLGLLAVSPAVALDPGEMPATASAKAHADLRRAVRADGKLTVEVRFLTDFAGYSGEKIYTDLDETAVHVDAGGQRYPLLRDAAGKPMAPQALELKFNYDPAKNPRVGSWKAVFVAPPAGVNEAVLILPNVAPIGPFPITDR